MGESCAAIVELQCLKICDGSLHVMWCNAAVMLLQRVGSTGSQVQAHLGLDQGPVPFVGLVRIPVLSPHLGHTFAPLCSGRLIWTCVCTLIWTCTWTETLTNTNTKLGLYAWILCKRRSEPAPGLGLIPHPRPLYRPFKFHTTIQVILVPDCQM